MRKNTMIKLVALTLAVVTALTPVNTFAASKKVVTYDEVFAKLDELAQEFPCPDAALYCDEVGEQLRPYFETLNGCYQENGLKIYTVFDGKTKTFKKTGSWSILVGGNTKYNNEGYVKFTAPKAGRYKFTLNNNENVLRGPVSVAARDSDSMNYKENSGSCYFCDKRTGTANISNYGKSTARKFVFSVTLKKGQSLKIYASSCESVYSYRLYANTYVGFDLKIEKTK